MAELENDPLELEPTVPAADVVVVEQLTPEPVPINRPRKVYAGMWGPFEIAAVAIAGLDDATLHGYCRRLLPAGTVIRTAVTGI